MKPLYMYDSYIRCAKSTETATHVFYLHTGLFASLYDLFGNEHGDQFTQLDRAGKHILVRDILILMSAIAGEI